MANLPPIRTMQKSQVPIDFSTLLSKNSLAAILFRFNPKSIHILFSKTFMHSRRSYAPFSAEPTPLFALDYQKNYFVRYWQWQYYHHLNSNGGCVIG